MSSIPVIDVSGLAGDSKARHGVALKIHDACMRIGFFCITGHGVSDELQQAIRRVALQVFDGTASQKKAVERRLPSYRGYIPLESEGLTRSLGRADAAVDLKEAFGIGPVDVPLDA